MLELNLRFRNFVQNFCPGFWSTWVDLIFLSWTWIKWSWLGSIRSRIKVSKTLHKGAKAVYGIISNKKFWRYRKMTHMVRTNWLPKKIKNFKHDLWVRKTAITLKFGIDIDTVIPEQSRFKVFQLTNPIRINYYNLW